MSYESRQQERNVMRIHKEVCELKELLIDHRSSQLLINAEVMSQMNEMKMLSRRYWKVVVCVKKLSERCKEQRVELNVLNKLLRGRLERCECGRRRRVRREEESRENEEGDVLEGGRENMKMENKRKEKRRRKREKNKRRIHEKNDKEIQTELGLADCVKETQTEEEETKFQYSQDIRRYIGQSIDKISKMGPVISLNDDGECSFILRNDYYDAWNYIVSGSNCVGSRPILLPDDLHGIVVSVHFYGNSSNRENFDIRLDAPQCKVNEGKELPLSLCLQIRVALTTGGYYTSDNHRFTINSFGDRVFAVPNNFVGSCKDTRRDTLPEIILKFSK